MNYHMMDQLNKWLRKQQTNMIWLTIDNLTTSREMMHKKAEGEKEGKEGKRSTTSYGINTNTQTTNYYNNQQIDNLYC